MSCLPLIGVTACTKQIGCHSYPSVADQHVCAFMVSAGSLLRVTPASAIHHEAAHDSLSIIKAAIAAGVPLMANRRGFQAVSSNSHYLALFPAIGEAVASARVNVELSFTG
jgi:enoyl-[acyl-carrier-protein] reductase (NADH)